MTQELSKAKYAGIPARSRDTSFHRDFQINMDQVFACERAPGSPGDGEDHASEEEVVNEFDFDEFQDPSSDK